MSTFYNILQKINRDNYFDIWQALHWFCADNHGGQYSTLYSILSQSPYKPAPSENSAPHLAFDFVYDEDNAPYIYCALRLYGAAQLYTGDDLWVSTIREVSNLADHYIVQYSDYTCRVYKADVDTLKVTDLTQI